MGKEQLTSTEPVPNEVGAPKSVIIVGAGPVGLFLAYNLAKTGIEVTVLEREKAINDAPRAVGYYAASALALKDAGLYNKIRKEGFMVKGLCWRKRPVSDREGGKRLGDIIAAQPLVEDMSVNDTDIQPGAGLLCLTQAELTRLFYREALATAKVTVHFQNVISGIEEDEISITATATNVEQNISNRYAADFLVGADGGRSSTRKMLNIPFPGHTWPERLLATDVMVYNGEDHVYHCHYILHRTNYCVSTPLSPPILGSKSLWRYTIALDPKDTRSDEEVLADDQIEKLYEEILPGRRPLDYQIQRRSVYRIHQRLAPTLRRGRSLLVGDAAHVNNPFGALGLNTGLLDADALGVALDMVLHQGKPLSVLDIYSDERRKVFQSFVDPTSTYNKLRIHTVDQEVAARDDWYFRIMQNPSKNDLLEGMRPYFEAWRTNMQEIVKEKGL